MDYIHGLTMPTYFLHLLGSFKLERDDQELNGFATDKVRALLAYLAVERQRPHRRESLSALLWMDQSDERARQNLRQALSYLKQALNGDELLLISQHDVQLHPQADIWIDVEEVEALVRACEKHRHRSIEHCPSCLHRQESLLGLYTGDFLEGFPSKNSENYEEWILLTRERLHQRAMTAHIALATMAERRGDLPASLHHTREQIRLEPWREEAHRQAMRLYALSGERSNALAQYQTCQHVLESELGVAPSIDTIALYETIKKDSISDPIVIPPGPPEASTSFIGRAREQIEITERLADPDCRLVTILGMGGIGKSRLALQVARSQAGLFRDGIFFIPMIMAVDAPSAIAAALGFTNPDAGSCLPNLLKEKEILLVLDNFEHLVETSDSLTELLDAAPGLQMIVTSRERLCLREEWTYILDGLSFPRKKDKVDSQSWDSMNLFENRACQIDSRFKLSQACLNDIAAICQLVEGQPLAIELAASAVAERSCAEIAESLHRTFDALAPTLRNFPTRHRSLRAVFEHSWKLLTTEERNRLAALSVFVGGFSVDAALDVAQTSMQYLAGLLAKSLVRRDTAGRYSIHEIIREFAGEKLENAEAVRAQHAAYYTDLASKFSATPSGMLLDLLQVDRANLRVAWNWSLLHDNSKMENLLAGLSLLYSLRGPLSEGETLFHEALQSQRGDPSRTELINRISIELARINISQARHDEAIGLVQNLTGTPLLRARALLTWGQALDAQGESEAARPILEQALALAHELSDKHIEADVLRELGNVANRLVEYDKAVPLYMKALALAYELGDKRGESATLNNWASVEWDLGKLEKARSLFLQALALYRELGNLLGEAKALNNLSNVAADQGDLSQALNYSELALGIHREMGNPRGQSAVLNNMGATYFCLGEFAVARKSYLLALDLYRASGNFQAEAETLANLSLLDCVEGRFFSGCENAQKAIILAEKVGDKVNKANALYYLGRNLLASGNIENGETSLNQALELRHEIPHLGRLIEIQTELAFAAHQRSESSLALALLAPALKVIADPTVLDGTDDPYRIYRLIVLILSASGNTQAKTIWQTGKKLLKKRAVKISDPLLRQSFQDAHADFMATEFSP
jgi:DNA-binding SARP family transcriptional activator/predicted ATPase